MLASSHGMNSGWISYMYTGRKSNRYSYDYFVNTTTPVNMTDKLISYFGYLYVYRCVCQHLLRIIVNDLEHDITSHFSYWHHTILSSWIHAVLINTSKHEFKQNGRDIEGKSTAGSFVKKILAFDNREEVWNSQHRVEILFIFCW